MAAVLNLASGGGVNAGKLRPVGSIYQSVVNADPGLLFGGTWQRYGKGRVAVGLNTADTDFSAAGKTGGAKTVPLTAAQMPAHKHTLTLSAATLPSAGSHTHNIPTTTLGLTEGDRDYAPISGGSRVSGYVEANAAHTHTVTPSGTVGSTGSGGAHTNLMPYFAVYAWKRVA